MSTDKQNHIENQVQEFHTHIQNSTLNLREKIKQIQEVITEWPLLKTKNVKRKHKRSVR